MVLIQSQRHQGRRPAWPRARPTVAHTAQCRVFHLINSTDVFNKDTTHFHSFMCDLSVVATKNTKRGSQGSLADEAKLPLPCSSFFFWISAAWEAVIACNLLCHHYRKYGFLWELGNKSQRNSPQPPVASWPHSYPALTLCWWAPESPQGQGTASPHCHLFPMGMCPHQWLQESHQQSQSTSSSSPVCAAREFKLPSERAGFVPLYIFTMQANENLVRKMSAIKRTDNWVCSVGFLLSFGLSGFFFVLIFLLLLFGLSFFFGCCLLELFWCFWWSFFTLETVPNKTSDWLVCFSFLPSFQHSRSHLIVQDILSTSALTEIKLRWSSLESKALGSHDDFSESKPFSFFGFSRTFKGLFQADGYEIHRMETCSSNGDGKVCIEGVIHLGLF